MKSLSEATAEATKRANIYEEETMRVNEMADKLEEQVARTMTVACLAQDSDGRWLCIW